MIALKNIGNAGIVCCENIEKMAKSLDETIMAL